MRTANWDAVRLARLITKGMTVIITGPAGSRRDRTETVEKAIPVVQKAVPVTPPVKKKRFFFFF